MKTLATFFSLVILVTTNLSAQNFAAIDKSPIIFEKIQNNIHVPTTMKENVSTERVRVVFSIDQNGRAHVMDVNTTREDLKASVTKQFEAIDFSDAIEAGNQTYSIWLNFKVV